MFFKIAAFEFRYQVRQPVFWIVTGLFFLLTFAVVTIDQISIGGLSANDNRNGPYALITYTQVTSLFFMFVTTAFVANIVVRDQETGFGPILWSTRVTKFDYLYGRFLGAFGAVAVAFLAVPLGSAVGSLMPWIDPEKLGPFLPQAYLFSYVMLGLPALLLTSAAFFALATVTRSMMATYLGVVVFFVIYLVASIWASKPELEQGAALFEPFGSAAVSLATKYWTTSERDTLTPAISGLFLWNRLMVLGLVAGFLGLAYALFHFGERQGKVRKAAAKPDPAPAVIEGPRPAPTFGVSSAMSQLWARTKLDMGQVFRSPAFLVLMALGLLNSIGGLWFADERYGAQLFPVTRVMIKTLEGSFTIFPLIIAIYYAGDLVWRERDRRTHDIVGATPLPDWAFVLPKTLAIALVLISTLLISVVAAILVQTLKGFHDYQIDKYLLWYVLPQSIDWILIAFLAVFLQAISPHKFIGWGLMALFIVVVLFTFPNIGLEHNLYRYGQSPTVPLSDMNGMGRFWVGPYWFRLYWAAFAVILLVFAYGLWGRGADTKMWPRLKRLPHRLNGPAGAIAAAALVVFACVGVYIYVNTNIWNPYRTRQADDRWLADYEKALLGYEALPQPTIVDEQLDVDLRPGRPSVTTVGTYVIENRTPAALREVHIRFPRDLEMRSLFVQGARPRRTYDEFNYRIFAFDSPMQPGERRTIAFNSRLSQRGFRNRDDMTAVVGNGTFVNDRMITPSLGVSRDDMLQDRGKRHKYGLPRELRMPRLGTPGADRFNPLGHDSDWVTSRIRVSTDADQIPIAPGYKVSDVIAGRRRTAVFRTEAPILRFFSIQSARYAVSAERYKGVDLAVYHHPPHDQNTGRIQNALKISLDYAQANFSPYQFRQIRVIEFPDYARFAQSFANTIPYSEGLGFITDFRDPAKIDLATYVTAHEVGHQWWAHQVIGADEQGSTLMVETLAQYTALMVMKHKYGADMIRKFLRYELDDYLRQRGGDVLPEQPLATVENQPYIHYRKGSLVMYRLQDEIGEEAVNRALRRLIARYAFKAAPYPTSRELIADIRAEAPADKQALITDLFERITLYDSKVVRAESTRRPDGRYDVAFTIEARKLYADGRGKETEAPLNETMDVGVFEVEPGKAGFGPSKVQSFQRVPIRTGRQVVRVVVDKPPRFAGVDPYNKIIDRNSGDNVLRVVAR
jgi:ABC-2 type transport system permease protein